VYVLVYVMDEMIYDILGSNNLENTFFGYIMQELGRFYTRCYLEHGVLDGYLDLNYIIQAGNKYIAFLCSG
jgi:hypothetical protein